MAKANVEKRGGHKLIIVFPLSPDFGSAETYGQLDLLFTAAAYFLRNRNRPQTRTGLRPTPSERLTNHHGVLMGVTPPGVFIWKTLFCCTVMLSGPTQASDWLIPEPARVSFQLVVTV